MTHLTEDEDTQLLPMMKEIASHVIQRLLADENQ